MSSLLEPIVIGENLSLRSRIVMGSMTRNRCVDDSKPGPAQARHYADRARYGAGLVVTEGIFVDWTGCEWNYAPVMVNDDHAKAWNKVVTFFQAWHAGRCQNEEMPALKERGKPVLAPSAIQARGGKFRNLAGTPGYTRNITVIDDPRDVIEMYRHSVQLAKNAGFDGVELLAQGGYLPHQFLCSRANTRVDAYGGSVENRCRFVLDLTDVISQVFGGYEFICVKLNPTDFYNDSVVTFEEMKETYTYLIKELVRRKVGIINLSRRGYELEEDTGNTTGITSRPDGYPLPLGYDPVLDFGPLVKFPGSPTKLMANHNYTATEADQLVQDGRLDLITFARPFIYNPDLVQRVKNGIAFAENDRGNSVFYGPYKTPDENYNDWPTAQA